MLQALLRHQCQRRRTLRLASLTECAHRLMMTREWRCEL